MSALRELLAVFHIDVESEDLKKGEKEVENFVEKLKKAGEAFLAAFAVEKIEGFLDAQIEAAAQLKITSERLGVETQELQAMQFAAGQAGVSSEAMGTALRFLNRNLAEAAEKGGEHAAAFAKLGIHIKDASGHTRSAGDIMSEFADAVAKVPEPAKQTQIAMELLGRHGASLLPLLKQGGVAFDDARKQVEALGGGLSDEFIEKAHKAEQEQKKFTFAMQGFKSEIANAMLPVLEHLVSGGIRVAVNLRDMATHTDILTHAFRAAVGLAIALAPGITAIASGAAILYLSFDELYTLLRGGDTLIGDALGPDKVKFVTDLRDAINDLLGETEDLSGASDEATDSWSGFKTIIVGVAQALAAVVKGIDWVMRAIDLLVLKVKALAPDQAGAEAALRVQAREADLAGGFGHAAEKDLNKREADAAKALEERNRPQQSVADKENSLATFAQEYADRHAQWESHGKKGYEPQATAAVAQYIQAHPEIVVHAPGGKGGKGGTVVHQTLNVHNELHPASTTDETAAIGELTDQTSTAVERANEHTYIAGNPP